MQADRFVLSQQQQQAAAASANTHLVTRARLEEGRGGRIVGPPPSPTNIAVHHKHEQQAGSDGYASASWEGSRIPPSPPRRHDGSEIQGVEEGGEGIGMTWHGWDEMMARPRPRRTPHTSLCFPGRLWVNRCAAGLRYHGVAILEPRALSSSSIHSRPYNSTTMSIWHRAGQPQFCGLANSPADALH